MPRPNLITLVLLLVCTAAQARPRRVAFFEPDIDYSNFEKVVGAFNTLLESLGPDWHFEPVLQQDQFDKLMADNQETFAFVSSSYLRTHANTALRPLLVPTSQGDVFYHKKLVSSKATNAADLQGKSIAVSGIGTGHNPAEAAVLRELAEIGTSNPVLFSVPDDIDALMAIDFSQVDAALVTPASLDVLKRNSPARVASLRELGETGKILRTAFCSKGGITKEDEDAITRKLTHLSDEPGGTEIMRHMAFDGMVPYNAVMLK